MLDFPPPPPPRERKPTRWLKWGCMGCGGLVLLVATFVGVSMWAIDGRALVASQAQARSEGQAAGDSTDEAGCVPAAKDYARRIGIMTHPAEVDIYTSRCLHFAMPTERFCEGVPHPYTPASEPWRRSRCRLQPFSTEYLGCSKVMEDVQAYCAEPDSLRFPVDTSAVDTTAAEDSADAADASTDTAASGRH